MEASMKQMLSMTIILLLLPVSTAVGAEEPTCRPVEQGVEVALETGPIVVVTQGKAYDCLLAGEMLHVALGAAGIASYRITGTDAAELVSTSVLPAGDVVRLRMDGNQAYAVLARFKLVPLALGDDGGLEPESLTGFLEPASDGRKAVRGEVRSATKGTQQGAGRDERPARPQRLVGKIIERQPAALIINIGADDGVKVGMHFEIRSQKLVRKFNLKAKQYEKLPSDEVTAVVETVQVSQNDSMLRLGRGNWARVGDLAVSTASALSETNWFPDYERSVNRLQARLGVFLGLQTTSVGLLTRLLYDRTFEFPLRVEVGFRNAAFLFGDRFAVPFQLDLIPSYDSDVFEIGLGVGYVFSKHPEMRGISFLQKVRLGTIDGLNATVWNSFLYRREVDANWSYMNYSRTGVGAECKFDNEGGDSRFVWNGLDAELSIPLTTRVTLSLHWAYSEGGWLAGELGIRTVVVGNGGKGTIIIPVSIGGIGVFDYVEASGGNSYDLSCDPDTNEVVPGMEDNLIAGPFVSIGIDYRF